MQVMACASAYAWACLSGWPADKWSSEWRREQPCSACGKNRTAAGKANRIFFGIKREGRAPFCFPTYNTAQTVAARSLRGVFGSLDIKGDLCPSERALYPGSRWRRSGHAAVVGNQSIALSCVKPFYRAIVPVNDEPSEEMYLYPAKQTKSPHAFANHPVSTAMTYKNM